MVVSNKTQQKNIFSNFPTQKKSDFFRILQYLFFNSTHSFGS